MRQMGSNHPSHDIKSTDFGWHVKAKKCVIKSRETLKLQGETVVAVFFLKFFIKNFCDRLALHRTPERAIDISGRCHHGEGNREGDCTKAALVQILSVVGSASRLSLVFTVSNVLFALLH